MKSRIFSCTICAAVAGLTSMESRAADISVPTFGPMFSNSAGYVNETQGEVFGSTPGWTVSTGYNGFGNVNLVGNGWQSPDGKATVEMDGQSPPGQISTILNVPSAGIVTVTFWMAGDPIANAGHADSPLSTLEVQLGSGVGVGPAVTNTFNSNGHTVTSMGWVQVSDNFTAAAGANYLTFSSLDFAGVDFSGGSDEGTALGTVSATENITPPGGIVADAGSSFLLLGLGAASLICLRSRSVASIS